jgi:hypothetical protein
MTSRVAKAKPARVVRLRTALWRLRRAEPQYRAMATELALNAGEL